jgi:hypothetical protein
MPTKLFFHFDIFGQAPLLLGSCLVYMFGGQKCMYFKQWTRGGAINFHVNIPLSLPSELWLKKFCYHAVITPTSTHPQTPSLVWKHCTLISKILLHTDILRVFLWFLKANAELHLKTCHRR